MSAATYIVHWPGQDTPACDIHTTHLEFLARAMGFFVSSTPAIGEIPCANCENEEKQHGQADAATDVDRGILPLDQ